MNNDFKFKVGDRIRLENWKEDEYIIIDCIGKKLFLYTDTLNDEGWHIKDKNWLPYIEPKKMVKIKIYKYLCYYGFNNYFVTDVSFNKEEYERKNLLRVIELLSEYEIEIEENK